MATNKSVLLPWIKKISYGDDSTLPIGKRLHLAVIQEAVFVQMLRLERRRTERSGKQFMLVLISGEEFRAESGTILLNNMVATISSCTRETDFLGWYERDTTLGLLMTEIGLADAATINIIVQKLSCALQNAVGPESFRRLTLIFRSIRPGRRMAGSIRSARLEARMITTSWRESTPSISEQNIGTNVERIFE